MKLLALGLMIATSIAVAAWARPSMVLTPVTGRFTSSDATAGSFSGAVSMHRAGQGEGGARRHVLGGWLLAMAGTAVVLRARRHRSI